MTKEAVSIVLTYLKDKVLEGMEEVDDPFYVGIMKTEANALCTAVEMLASQPGPETQEQCKHCKCKHLWDTIMNDLDQRIMYGTNPERGSCATCLYNDEPWDSDPCEECMNGNSHYTEISYDIQK